MINLDGVYFKRPETLGPGEFRAVVERLLVSFPGAHIALVAAGEKWFRHAAANAPGRVPSLEISLEIEFGLSYSPMLLEPTPGPAIAKLLQVPVEDAQ